MRRYDADALLGLLPAYHRVRDESGALRALMEVLAAEIGIVEDDLDALYADSFIETCAPWAVPYLGDLIGYRPLPGGTTRAEVANAIRTRRRKGTAGVLEDLARDVTGFEAAAVEYFQRLALTAHLAHPRLDHPGTASLRDVKALDRIGTAFDALPRNLEVRRIGSGRGRHNIPNVGIALYRTRVLSVPEGMPYAVANGVYTFHPLGRDMPLYRPAVPKQGGRTQEANVPVPVRRRTLAKTLDDYRQALTEIDPAEPPTLPFRIVLDGVEVKPEEIVACDIADGAAPFAAASALRRHVRSTDPSFAHDYPIKVALDAVRGRFVLRDDLDPATLRVAYAFGVPAPLGGGPYGWTSPEGPATATVATDLGSLLDGTATVVQIPDGRTLTEDLALTLAAAPAESQIVIRGLGGHRPTLRAAGGVTIDGAAGEVVFEGLLVEGALTVTGDVSRVVLRHCTWLGAIRSESEVVLERSVVGSVESERLAATDSVILAEVETGLLHFDGVTAFGPVAANGIEEVSNSIVVGPLVASHLGDGCVRFSGLGPGSSVPKPHRCTDAMPVFVSKDPSHPGFARLHPFCPPALATGADDGGEMGAHHFLQEPAREANLRIRLDENLRLGLEAGLERADLQELLR